METFIYDLIGSAGCRVREMVMVGKICQVQPGKSKVRSFRIIAKLAILNKDIFGFFMSLNFLSKTQKK